jgi:hypothetical protein
MSTDTAGSAQARGAADAGLPLGASGFLSMVIGMVIGMIIRMSSPWSSTW